MSPRNAILILLVIAVLGTSVMGFFYFQQQKVIKENQIANIKEKSIKIQQEKKFKRGTEEYYRHLVDEINSELEREKMEKGSISMESKKRSVDKINEVLRMKYNNLSLEAKEQRDLAVKQKQEEIRIINEEIIKNNQ